MRFSSDVYEIILWNFDSFDRLNNLAEKEKDFRHFSNNSFEMIDHRTPFSLCFFVLAGFPLVLPAVWSKVYRCALAYALETAF